jgi:hypothetical protein
LIFNHSLPLRDAILDDESFFSRSVSAPLDVKSTPKKRTSFSNVLHRNFFGNLGITAYVVSKIVWVQKCLIFFVFKHASAAWMTCNAVLFSSSLKRVSNIHASYPLVRPVPLAERAHLQIYKRTVMEARSDGS